MRLNKIMIGGLLLQIGAIHCSKEPKIQIRSSRPMITSEASLTTETPTSTATTEVDTQKQYLIDQIATVQKQVEDAKKNVIDASLAAKAEADKAVAEAKAKTDRAEADLAKALGELEDTKKLTDTSTATQLIEDAQNKVSAAQNAKALADNALAQANLQLNNLQQQLSAVQVQLDTKTNDLNTAQSQSAFVSNQLSNSQNAYNASQAELSSARSELDSSLVQLANAQSQLNSMQDSYSASQAQLGAVQSDLDASQTQLTNVSNQLSSAKTDLTTAVAAYNGSQTQLTAAQNALAQALARLAELRKAACNDRNTQSTNALGPSYTWNDATGTCSVAMGVTAVDWLSASKFSSSSCASSSKQVMVGAQAYDLNGGDTTSGCVNAFETANFNRTVNLVAFSFPPPQSTMNATSGLTECSANSIATGFCGNCDNSGNLAKLSCSPINAAGFQLDCSAPKYLSEANGSTSLSLGAPTPQYSDTGFDVIVGICFTENSQSGSSSLMNTGTCKKPQSGRPSLTGQNMVIKYCRLKPYSI